MSTCTRCGAAFSCGAADAASAPCWCMQLPNVAAVPPTAAGAGAAGCWCRACLEQHIAQSRAAASATPADGGAG